MFGLVQKIILTVITFIIIISFGIGLFTILRSTNYNLNLRQLFTVIVLIISICSFIFHIKTIPFYKKKIHNKETVDKWLWIVNTIFGIIMVLYGLFLAYMISDFIEKQYQTEYLYIILMTILISLFGAWILIDVRYLHRKVKKLEAQSVIDSIDNITGTEGKN